MFKPSWWGRQKQILLVSIHSGVGWYVLQICARLELIRLVVDKIECLDNRCVCYSKGLD